MGRKLFIRILILILFIQHILSNLVHAQDISVPDSILAEMQHKTILIYNEVYEYKIVYPKIYDVSKRYPVFLGLSGGLANEPIVNFCYYAWFRSKYFSNYITILPISPDKNFLMDLSEIKILNLLNSFIEYENTLISNWIIAGTSNGGVTAFKFALTKPSLFEGIIVLPGAFNFLKPPVELKDYKIIIAYGEKDSEWKSNSLQLVNDLKGIVKKLTLFEMKGQDHILNPNYDIDSVYQLYFER